MSLRSCSNDSLALAQVSRQFDDEIWLPAFAAVISCDFSQRPDDIRRPHNTITSHSEMLKFNQN